jgi:hypothetical protein
MSCLLAVTWQQPPLPLATSFPATPEISQESVGNILR